MRNSTQWPGALNQYICPSLCLLSAPPGATGSPCAGHVSTGHKAAWYWPENDATLHFSEALLFVQLGKDN